MILIAIEVIFEDLRDRIFKMPDTFFLPYNLTFFAQCHIVGGQVLVFTCKQQYVLSLSYATPKCIQLCSDTYI